MGAENSIKHFNNKKQTGAGPSGADQKALQVKSEVQ
jgi:hypothetical protein